VTKSASLKAVHVGPLLKESFKFADKQRGLAFCGFTSVKPVLLIMGGSQGARGINQMVKNVLSELIDKFQVVHICGEGKVDCHLSMSGYKSYEFISSCELPHLIATADVVVSRAGSNTMMELLFMQKPMLLIPHTNGGSRSGQLAQAQYFQQTGFAELLLEEEMTAPSFVHSIMKLYEKRAAYKGRMRLYENGRGAHKVMNLIKQASGEDLTMIKVGKG
jgi:UDP-N-acetylglucosamine--N-acetylmuramyl-(pentapeptide) pyrophosphoryl-undecaprenol N-acetylglucosamine transferase